MCTHVWLDLHHSAFFLAQYLPSSSTNYLVYFRQLRILEQREVLFKLVLLVMCISTIILSLLTRTVDNLGLLVLVDKEIGPEFVE